MMFIILQLVILVSATDSVIHEDAPHFFTIAYFFHKIHKELGRSVRVFVD